MKKIEAAYYTRDKRRFGRHKSIPDNPENYLWSLGEYRTKIRLDDLPEWYCSVLDRCTDYGPGWVKTRGVTEVKYTYVKENHLFKDDYLYISYGEPMIPVYGHYVKDRIIDYEGAVCFDGLDILDLILYIEHYSPEADTSEVRRMIDEKILYLHDHEKEYYRSCFGTSDLINIWEHCADQLPKFD